MRKSSALAMYRIVRGCTFPIAGMSHQDSWLETISTGPSGGDVLGADTARAQQDPGHDRPACAAAPTTTGRSRSSSGAVTPPPPPAAAPARRRRARVSSDVSMTWASGAGASCSASCRSRAAIVSPTSAAVEPEIGRAAGGPRLERRDQVHLDVRAGADAGAGVTALEHGVVRQRPLAGAHPLAHLRVARDGAHPRRDRLAAQVDRRRRGPADQPGQRVAVVGVDAVLHRGRGQLAVHRARVDVAVAEPVGERPRDRALARAGGPVDRDHHRAPTAPKGV